MITEAQLQSAIDAGILDADTAKALKAHQPNTNQRNNIVDEEHFRLISGFNDIFVVIACILLFLSLAWISGNNMIGSALIAITAWGLAEFFVLKRRMALPAIVLLIYFVGSVCIFSINSFTESPRTLSASNPLPITAACIISMLATWLHWKRFKVPITVSAGAAFCVTAVMMTAVSLTDNNHILMPLTSLLGLGVFALAMRWDAADTARETRKSDVGFWLHLLAAPLIIHPIFELIGVLDKQVSLLGASIVLGLYLIIAGVSLAIDRRALMVSALGYVIYVFSELLSDRHHSSTSFAVTMLIIGSALLMLSAFWHRCRIAVLQYVPVSIKRYLPHG